MKKKVLKIIFVAVILLFLVIQLYPVVWLFMASLKSSAELGSQPFALPKALVFSNYAEIFKDGKIFKPSRKANRQAAEQPYESNLSGNFPLKTNRR